MNIVDTIFSETTEFTGKKALQQGELCLSYADLAYVVKNCSQLLQEKGLKAYDSVAFVCDDSIEYVVVTLSILALGAVIVPISASLSLDEVDNVIERMQVQYLIADKSVIANCGENSILVSQREFSIKEIYNSDHIDDDFKKMNPAFIRFSSGTTGASKGVLLSHQSILERTDAANQGLNITSDDNVIWLLSMSFHFVVTILLFLRKGATIVIAGNDFPTGLLNSLQSVEATFIYASPFHYNVLSSNSSFSKDLLKYVRMAVSTAIALPRSIADKFVAKFDMNLSQAYGIIEVGLPFINSELSSEKSDSVGRLLPGYEIMITNADVKGCGEILLKGKGMYEAYVSPWKKRKEWFDTGDIGYLDEDGYLFIVGRSKNVINFSGMKIFPYEVENVLNAHEAIKESLVYPVDHDDYGQLPVAKVVLADGYDELPRADLRRYCHKNLSSYKTPKKYEIVTELERTASGKIKRN